MNTQQHSSNVLLEVKCRICSRRFALQVDAENFKAWCDRKLLIQEAFPDMSVADRELMISRTCGDCFNDLFPRDDEDESEEEVS